MIIVTGKLGTATKAEEKKENNEEPLKEVNGENVQNNEIKDDLPPLPPGSPPKAPPPPEPSSVPPLPMRNYCGLLIFTMRCKEITRWCIRSRDTIQECELSTF